MIELFKGNDNVLQVTDLRLRDAGGFLVAATVTANLYDSSGALVADGSNITLTDQSGGIYEGPLPSTADLSAGGGLLVVSVDDGAGHEAQFNIPATFVYRN